MRSNEKRAPTGSSQSGRQAADSDTDHLGAPANSEQESPEDDGNSGPVFTIANEEESSDTVAFANPGSDGKRYSTQLRWSVTKNCTPTQSSLDFYAKRRQSQSQLSRRSQLAEELGQMELTRSLASSQCSPAVVPNLTKLAPGARSQQRHSLRYPSVGSLDLNEFLGSSSADSDSDELATNTAGKKRKEKSAKKKDRNK